jgi:hypothetical protein
MIAARDSLQPVSLSSPVIKVPTGSNAVKPPTYAAPKPPTYAAPKPPAPETPAPNAPAAKSPSLAGSLVSAAGNGAIGAATFKGGSVLMNETITAIADEFRKMIPRASLNDLD